MHVSGREAGLPSRFPTSRRPRLIPDMEGNYSSPDGPPPSPMTKFDKREQLKSPGSPTLALTYVGKAAS